MKSRQFRRKVALPSAAAADEEEDAGPTITPAALATSRRNKQKEAGKSRQSRAGRLSFENLDDQPSVPRLPERSTPIVQLDPARFQQLNVNTASARPYSTQTAAPGTCSVLAAASRPI